MTIGKKIRELRAAKGWTMYELGKISGVSRSTIRGVELGHYRAALSALEKIAVALGVPMSEFDNCEERNGKEGLGSAQNREICKKCAHWRHFVEGYFACHYCIDCDDGLSGFNQETGECTTFKPRKRGSSNVKALVVGRSQTKGV